MRIKKERSLHFGLKKAVLTGFIIFCVTVTVYSQEPELNRIDVQTQLETFELKLQNDLLEIANQEKQLIQRHDSICLTIESKIKEGNDKKSLAKLSQKEQNNLEERLEMEYRTIEMIKQMSMISRGEIRKEYELEVEDFFEKYDGYLSKQ